MQKRVISAAVVLVLALLAPGLASASKHPLVPGKVEDWYRFEVEDIEVVTNASVDRAIEDISTLRALRKIMCSLLIEGTEEHLPPLTFVLFGEREDFERYQPWYEGKRMEVGGWFVPALDRNTMVVDVSQRSFARPILQHEFVHAWISANLPLLPLWMNEGFAEFYSTFRIEDDLAIVGEPIDWHLESLAKRTPIGFPRLTDLGHDAPEYNEGRRTSMLYAQAWGLVQYFMTTRERRIGLSKFIEEVHRGTHHAKALEKSFGVRFEVIDQEMLALKNRPKWPVFRLKSEGRVDLDDVVVERLDAKSTLITLGEVLARLGDSEPGLAQAHFDAALDLEPGSVRALRGIAMRQRVEGLSSVALETLDRVLALAPDDPEANVEKGLLLFQQWQENERSAQESLPDGPPEALATARAHFERALAARPQHAIATAGHGMTYLGEKNPVIGVRSMERARRTLTWDPLLLSMEIMLRSRVKDLERARELLDGDLRQRLSASRARGAVDLIELVVVGAEVERVNALARAGETETAAVIVERALEATASPAVTAQMRSLQRSLQRDLAERAAIPDPEAARRSLQLVNEYERAVALAQGGETSEALGILRGLLELQEVTPARRAEIEAAIRENE